MSEPTDQPDAPNPPPDANQASPVHQSDVNPADPLHQPDVNPAGPVHQSDANQPESRDDPPAADPLELRQADEAALAVGFSLATGLEIAVSRDGAGTPVIDVPVTSWVVAARHARDVLELDFLDWLSA